MQRLREATQGDHEAAEAAFGLPGRLDDRASYAELLARMAPFYEALESKLARFDWASIGLDYGPRRKAGWLRQDLAALGQGAAAASAAPASGAIPSPSTLPQAVGCAYVLEGATLGGQMISRELTARGLTPATGARFYSGYGPDTGACWQAFKAAAERACPDEPSITTAVASAQQTFHALTSLARP